MENYEKMYKEAFDRAKFLKENADNVGTKDISYTFEYIFPELKESEDEMIRKGIMEYFKYLPVNDDWHIGNSNVTIKDAIAWLEKQKSIDILDEEEREFADNADSIRKEIDEAYQKGYNEGRRIENKDRLEKQGEQKTTCNEDYKNIIEWLIGYLEYRIMNTAIIEEKKNCLNSVAWLKSIKPNNWKPSEEQMLTLCSLCVLHKESKVLESLYNDLKTL